MRIRLLAPLVVVALAVAVLASPAAEAGAAKTCPTSGLVALAEVPGSGTAGSVVYRLELTNLSGSTCTVSGYPKVSAVSLEGRRIGAVATRAPGRKVRPVRLTQGESATATLQIVEALNYPPSECRPTWAAGVRISVPGSPGSRIAPLAFQTCALAGVRILSVGPVTAAD
ncbi:MAG TPA: DUF4232 domain-containing protein [Solirubrobacterales bacterium]|nr:DUF4232 domain-containing protein [Solirubrobacterales bacterium]